MKLDLSNPQNYLASYDYHNFSHSGVPVLTQGSEVPIPVHSGQKYEFYPGKVIPENVMERFKKMNTGRKGDLYFLKTIALLMFGPETLASSSIEGTKRGGKKKGKQIAEEKKVRKGLDKEMLSALKEYYVKERLQPVLGQYVDPRTEPRAQDKYIYEAIRQRQTVLRRNGYGKGELSNEITPETLCAD